MWETAIEFMKTIGTWLVYTGEVGAIFLTAYAVLRGVIFFCDKIKELVAK